MGTPVDRRHFLKKSVAAGTGAALVLSFEEKALLAQQKKSASNPAKKYADFPAGKIGDLNISRLICGGNLTSTFAHSRDLIYVSALLKNYFTDEKIFQTWRLCEENGVNTAVLRLDNQVLRLINDYWHNEGSGAVLVSGSTTRQYLTNSLINSNHLIG